MPDAIDKISASLASWDAIAARMKAEAERLVALDIERQAEAYDRRQHLPRLLRAFDLDAPAAEIVEELKRALLRELNAVRGDHWTRHGTGMGRCIRFRAAILAEQRRADDDAAFEREWPERLASMAIRAGREAA